VDPAAADQPHAAGDAPREAHPQAAGRGGLLLFQKFKNSNKYNILGVLFKS
jgi:hypothetical protein